MWTRAPKFLMVAALCASGLCVAVAFGVDWLGSRAAGVPWLASLASRQGQCFYTQTNDPGVPHLVPITQMQFDRRLAYASMAGWLSAIGLWIALVSAALLGAKYVMKTEAALSRRERAYRAVLFAVIVLNAGLVAAYFAAGILGAKLTGAPFNGAAEVGREGAYFQGRAGFEMPISPEQYNLWKDLESVGRFFWATLVLGLIGLFLVRVVGGVLVRRPILPERDRGVEADDTK